MKTSFAGLVGLAGVLALAAFTPPVAGFKVVVNPANAIKSVPVKQLADLYLKRTVQWPTGERAQAVDLPGNSPVRSAFSRAVLGRSASAIAAYWQQQIFSGRSVPPVEMRSDAEVLTFVRSNAGAVGYVSAESVTTDLRVVEVTP